VCVCDLLIFYLSSAILAKVFVLGFGVLFLSCMCVCVSVPGVLFSVGVCVCDLLIFLPEERNPGQGVRIGVWGVVLVVYVCVCRCRGCYSLSVCVCVCVCDLLIFLHGKDTRAEGRHGSNMDRGSKI